MENEKFKDELVLPIMQAHGTTREEAEKRLDLLTKSGLLDGFNSDHIVTKMRIDQFLATDSEQLRVLVAYHAAFTECVTNKDLVRQYDRLQYRSFGKALAALEKGNPPKNINKQFEDFEKFCIEFIFSRLKPNDEQ